MTSNGRPVEEFLGPKPARGVDLAAIERFKAARGHKLLIAYIAPDFDDPLDEDVLLKPLPKRR